MMDMNDMPLNQTAVPLNAAALPLNGDGAWAAPVHTFRIEPSQALVISKQFAGLSADWVDHARDVVKTAARRTPSAFIVARVSAR